MIKGKIKITLKSDICLASGYSYAGIIDTDTCYDDFGFPYIPARRLKGCLKEAAEMISINSDNIGKLYGKNGGGFNERASLTIGNARIEDYNLLSEYVNNHKNIIEKERILDQYTSVKAQTRLENGVAKERSLRFTRIVNHYNPLNNNELCFYSAFSIESENKESENSLYEDLNKCAKALRHIGYNRNRGLGNVKCEVIRCSYEETTADKNEIKTTDTYTLKYTIKTVSPVIISQNGRLDTETYISGRLIHGFLATRYLKAENSADNNVNKVFEEMFLRNNVIFSPLYPSDEDGNIIYYPAPEYIGILKKTKCLVNTSLEEIPVLPDDNVASISRGNQAKKLKGKYISYAEGEYKVKEVITEIVYHNRHKKGDNDALLYPQEAISVGQYFTGTITGSYNEILKLKNLLSTNTITLGRSISAQYGECIIVGEPLISKKDDSETLDLKEGDEILVIFESDGIFISDSNGCTDYTCRPSNISQIIKEKIAGNDILADGNYAEVVSKKLTGYYSKWNMKRQSIPAISAGSGFSYIVSKDVSIPVLLHVGENNGEGFGIVRVIKKQSEWVLKKPVDKVIDPATDTLKEFRNTLKLYKDSNSDSVKSLLKEILMKLALELAEEKASKVSKSKLNSSSVGRLTLMLQESEIEAGESNESIEACLHKRLESIKRKDKNEASLKFVKEYYVCPFDEECDDFLDIETIKIFLLRKALVWLKYKTKE